MKHEQHGMSDEWYTPKYIFDAFECHFDLDVASPVNRQFCHVPADAYITEDSLEKEWNGFVWMNAPFGHQKDKFLWLTNQLCIYPHDQVLLKVLKFMLKCI